jgi:hypothetical protein
MQKTDLCILAEKYGADKCPAILHSYTPDYNNILTPIRFSANLVVEIGVGNPQCMISIVGHSYKAGASLRMWQDFFPSANIIGCDIRSDVLFEENRIKCLYLDQSSSESLEQLYSTVNNTYGKADLILDDGSHVKEHQEISFQHLWKLVKVGGFYIIEDICGDTSSIEFTMLPSKYGFTNFEFVFIKKSIHVKHGNWYYICFKKTS